MGLRWRLQSVLIDRSWSTIRSQLLNSSFDYVVYTWLRASKFDDLVAVHVPKDRVVAVDGQDHMPTFLWNWTRRVGFMFKFNLQDTCPESTHQLQNPKARSARDAKR